jgi:hypothetical protein
MYTTSYPSEFKKLTPSCHPFGLFQYFAKAVACGAIQTKFIVNLRVDVKNQFSVP